MLINKFNSEEALCESYQKLEKEFTRKCQELAKVKKELEEKIEKQETFISSEPEFEEVVLPAGLEEVSGDNETLNNESVTTSESVVSNQIEEVVDRVNEDKKETTTTQNEYFNLDFRAKAGEFMQKTPKARAFAKEISKILLTDKTLLNCSDPFGVAFALALKNASEKNSELKTSEVKEGEEEQVVTPQMIIPKISVLSSGVIGTSPRETKKRFNSISDAGEEILKRLI